jgi:hypothetical protein
MTDWLMLVASIPGPTRAARMRIWRALKACGAATVRDGVYLLPDGAASRREFAARSEEIESAGGNAFVLPLGNVLPRERDAFRALFDREPEYARLAQSLERFQRALSRSGETDARRQLAAYRREAEALHAIDFFDTRLRRRVELAFRSVEKALNARFVADEPSAVSASIVRRSKSQYRRKLWATRRHLWIDRVCSAWLIRRFIDPHAKFVWLADPGKCPASAVGFDFDGAAFTHVSGRVTFEVLAASFALADEPGIRRLGALVRYLDVGGSPVSEAAGVETIMAGLRATCPDDDAILAAMSPVLDGLYSAYSAGSARG